MDSSICCYYNLYIITRKNSNYRRFNVQRLQSIENKFIVIIILDEVSKQMCASRISFASQAICSMSHCTAAHWLQVVLSTHI